MRKAVDEITLVRPSADYARQIDEYRAEFPSDRERVTLDPDRIPGADYLEDYASAAEWLDFCESEKERISWFMSVRRSDGRIVGMSCLRHKLEYDDDDIEFASHIGYSVRPSERGRGYAEQQLRLLLLEAKKLGIDTVRLVCSDKNEASRRTILANGGIPAGTVRGEESGITIERYDIHIE